MFLSLRPPRNLICVSDPCQSLVLPRVVDLTSVEGVSPDSCIIQVFNYSVVRGTVCGNEKRPREVNLKEDVKVTLKDVGYGT